MLLLGSVTGLPQRFRPLLATGLAALTLAWSDDIAEEADPAPELHVDALHDDHHPHVRESLRGTAFPDGVLALTWDDGPDKHTLELAKFLRSRRVAGTFFVVRAWDDSVSEEPGRGPDRFATGYAHLPVLSDLVALGQRIGNHTDGHVLLGALPLERVVEQIGRNQAALDPFLANELRMFRAPAGYWSESASVALEQAAFSHTVGPFRWDIDEKDWSASVDGLSPRVVAKRYLATAVRLKKGIVLFHDRVGAVGSSFALDLAKELVPALEAQGFVFAAPLLSFTAFEPRLADTKVAGVAGALRLGDLDGDGRADLCTDTLCARSAFVPRASGALPRSAFVAASRVDASDVLLGDVDGDGRADLCRKRGHAVACARASGGGYQTWLEMPDSRGDLLRLADLDGDGRADACIRNDEGIVCATSTGSSFDAAHPWIDASAIDPSRVELGDIDGDGRADACSAGTCALSTGRSFGAPVRWSSAKELVSADEARFGDLNGDGRADVCVPTSDGIACAFSNGRAFTAPTLWLDRHLASFDLADINADGRADLCAIVDEKINCALAP
jgi:peptidoglycan/xylan/chitin deacetylase (PgdA/CDA1 family)